MVIKPVYLFDNQTIKYINNFKSNYDKILEVAKLSRSPRSKICKEQFYTSLNSSFCASQNRSYYGYKIPATCSVGGVSKSFDMSKVSLDDIHCLKDIKTQLNDCVILGYKGCLSTGYQLDLFKIKRIKLEFPRYKNQCNYKKQVYIFR